MTKSEQNRILKYLGRKKHLIPIGRMITRCVDTDHLKVSNIEPKEYLRDKPQFWNVLHWKWFFENIKVNEGEK